MLDTSIYDFSVYVWYLVKTSLNGQMLMLQKYRGQFDHEKSGRNHEKH